MFKTQTTRKKAKLSIAPLLDMIFILLIFFVVTTTFSKLPGVPIEKPESDQAQTLPPNNIIIGVTAIGDIYINKHKLTLDELLEKLTLKRSVNKELNAVILADKELRLKFLVKVMDICKKAGIKNVALAEELPL